MGTGPMFHPNPCLLGRGAQLEAGLYGLHTTGAGWGRFSHFLGAQSPRTTGGSEAWAIAPTVLYPSPPRSRMDSQASLCCVLSPPYPYLPPPGRPPVLLSPRDPANLSSALPTEGHPRGGSPSLSRHNSLAYQALHGPASAEPWSPGTHNMLATPPFHLRWL